MSSVRISVIMPAYNSEKYVSEAMQSIIAQTHKSWELIAVDDGSTDNTGRIIDEYAVRDSRIKVVHTENRGVSHARNIGLDLAKGEWVAFLDSDDMYELDAFEIMLRETTDANMLIGDFKMYPEMGGKSGIINKKRYHHFRDMKDDLLQYMNAGVLSSVDGKIIKRDRIRVRFCEDCNHGEDTLFIFSLLESVGSIKLIPNSLYIYRRNNKESLTHQFAPGYERILQLISESYIRYFEDVRVTEIMYARYLNGIITNLKALFHTHDYTDDYIIEYISAFIKNDFLRQIPLTQYPLSPYRQRMASLLLIGDIDLIMDAFRKKYR